MEVTLKILILAILTLSQVYGYSEFLSSKMIHLSKAIYDISKEDQAAKKCPECYEHYTVLQQILGNNILALIGVDQEIKAVVIVFRGSNNVPNFITDANIFTTSYDDMACNKCKVHGGFYNSYDRLLDQGLKAAINKAVDANPTYSVIFTGHSLGGAVANLAAVAFKKERPKTSVSIYTYGQPRAGNSNYAEYVNKNVPENYRVVHKKDIVPHKPSYYIQYRHSGTEIWYKDGMKGAFIRCEPESSYCSNGSGSLNINFSVNDHLSRNYIELMDKFQSGIKAKSGKKTKPSKEASPSIQPGNAWVTFEHAADFLAGQFEFPDSDLFEDHPEDEM